METKMNKLADLQNVKETLINARAKKVEYTPFTGVVLKKDTIIVSNYEPSYMNEISKVTSNPLDKRDIVNIKKYSDFMKYWFDYKKQTITIGQNKYNILKVKGVVYFKNINNNIDVINANKEFKLAKILNKTKLLQKMVEKINEKRVNI